MLYYIIINHNKNHEEIDLSYLIKAESISSEASVAM